MSHVRKNIKTLIKAFPKLEKKVRSFLMLRKYLNRKNEGIRFLKQYYKSFYGKDLPPQPQLFTEKVFHWLIYLHKTDNRDFARFVDKYEVRHFVRKRLGDEHLPKLYWQGLDARSIPYDRLPETFILKSNHGSGHVIKIKKGIDVGSVSARSSRWLQENFYWAGREYQYLYIKPRLLAEELLDDGREDGPLDYRFWCFNGVPKMVQVDNHDHSINNFYDLNWNLLNLTYRNDSELPDISIPENFEKMVKLASRISKGFDFVRVDLYNIHGRILFGELTFTPVGGRIKFSPIDWDTRLGELWKFQN